MMLKNISLMMLALCLLSPSAWADNLPKLVDIGADKCIPCIKMAPILEKMKEEFSGEMDIEFIDAWKHREEAANYGVRMIPTQIFYSEKGSELFRHTGFYAREDILKKWLELGYRFTRKD